MILAHHSLTTLNVFMLMIAMLIHLLMHWSSDA
jgi:hypothetical protein